MQTLSWYFHRLGRMSAPELAYRVTQVARAATERWTEELSRPAPKIHNPPTPRRFIDTAPNLDPAAYIRQAESIMAGRFSIFDLEGCDLGHPPQWNRDPLTGRIAPLTRAASLDYRDERLVGNIKYLWEPNRHLHIPRLAQAYALTGELRYALEVRLQIESWLDQCPYGRGPNWTSSLELAIRLINWSLAWQLLGGYESAVFAGTDGENFRERWLASVYLHARAIGRKLSRFSSANNHLIGETAGVWIASVTWDCWPEMRAWGQRCKRILAGEALKQNAEDGGNREQAFSYQQFVLDFLLFSGLAARAAGDDFPAEYWQRIECMIDFIASMMDGSGHVPMIGDADDGYVVSLATDPRFDNYASLVASGGVLFGREDLRAKARAVDEKTQWLAGGGRARPLPVPPPQAGEGKKTEFQPRRAFPQAGYYLLGDEFGTADEVRLLADAGPLGYLSIAAHGHADALSIVLNVGGHEVLVDPGTYAYHTEPQWRRYFRSTRAHNTVMIDEQDQSTQSGNFMWSRHAKARMVQFELSPARQRFVGEHDGYRVLADPVTHRREIVYEPDKRMFTLTDTIECGAAHEIVRPWHFAESLQPEVRGNAIHVSVGRFRVRLVAAEEQTSTARYHAGTAEQGGWISRRFGVKVPTTTLVWRSAIQGTAALRTYIYIESQPPARGA